MSRTKDHYWPDEPPAPRPMIHAIKAAWREFWRDLNQQRRRSNVPDPFKVKA